MNKLILLLSVLILVISCSKETKYNNIPKISFLDLSHNLVKAGGDTLVKIRFDFEDGDGNIGFGTDNLFLMDSRSGDTIPFRIPEIPEKFNPKNGLKGVIVVEYPAALLLLRTDTAHLKRDTLTWAMFMKDEAKNASNVIVSTPLILVDSL